MNTSACTIKGQRTCQDLPIALFPRFKVSDNSTQLSLSSLLSPSLRTADQSLLDGNPRLLRLLIGMLSRAGDWLEAVLQLIITTGADSSDPWLNLVVLDF